MGERPRHELFAGLASLYQSREYADLVLVGKEGSRHSVHKAIVCPRSEYLHNAAKKGKWKSGEMGELALADDDELVRLVIEYMYLLDYDPVISLTDLPDVDRAHPSRDSSDSVSVRTDAGNYGHIYGASAVSAFGGPSLSNSPSSALYRPRTNIPLTAHALPRSSTDFETYAQPPRRRKTTRGGATNAPDPSPLATKTPHLVLHARMYAAGDKYGIPGLKALSLDKFKMQTTRHWDSPELAEAIHVIYSSTPATDKDMRDAVADTLGWHGRLLDKPEIEVAILEFNGLAYELLKRSRRAEPEYMD